MLCLSPLQRITSTQESFRRDNGIKMAWPKCGMLDLTSPPSSPAGKRVRSGSAHGPLLAPSAHFGPPPFAPPSLDPPKNRPARATSRPQAMDDVFQAHVPPSAAVGVPKPKGGTEAALRSSNPASGQPPFHFRPPTAFLLRPCPSPFSLGRHVEPRSLRVRGSLNGLPPGSGRSARVP